MADELNENAEFGRKRKNEEEPILVAQRFLNIYRQMHIFNQERRDEFDKMLLDMPSDIRILLSTLPGGSLLIEHIEELEQQQGLALGPQTVKSGISKKVGKNNSDNNNRAAAGTVVIDASFASELSSSLSMALQQTERRYKEDIKTLTETITHSITESQSAIGNMIKDILLSARQVSFERSTPVADTPLSLEPTVANDALVLKESGNDTDDTLPAQVQTVLQDTNDIESETPAPDIVTENPAVDDTLSDLTDVRKNDDILPITETDTLSEPTETENITVAASDEPDFEKIKNMADEINAQLNKKKKKKKKKKNKDNNAQTSQPAESLATTVTTTTFEDAVPPIEDTENEVYQELSDENILPENFDTPSEFEVPSEDKEVPPLHDFQTDDEDATFEDIRVDDFLDNELQNAAEEEILPVEPEPLAEFTDTPDETTLSSSESPYENELDKIRLALQDGMDDHDTDNDSVDMTADITYDLPLSDDTTVTELTDISESTESDIQAKQESIIPESPKSAPIAEETPIESNPKPLNSDRPQNASVPSQKNDEVVTLDSFQSQPVSLDSISDTPISLDNFGLEPFSSAGLASNQEEIVPPDYNPTFTPAPENNAQAPQQTAQNSDWVFVNENTPQLNGNEDQSNNGSDEGDWEWEYVEDNGSNDSDWEWEYVEDDGSDEGDWEWEYVEDNENK